MTGGVWDENGARWWKTVVEGLDFGVSKIGRSFFELQIMISGRDIRLNHLYVSETSKLFQASITSKTQVVNTPDQSRVSRLAWKIHRVGLHEKFPLRRTGA